MKAVVGLGNPGLAYRNTRHNAGFMVVDLVADRLKAPIRRRGPKALLGEGRLDDFRVILAKPQTYMNNSGEAVRALLDYYRLSPTDLLVVCDDVNLPLGRLRLRARGSAGGHNGLKSIIAHLGTEEFPRLRLGVGTPEPGEMVDHVLGRFAKAERDLLREQVGRAADAVECFLQAGIDEAMNRFNVRAA